MKTLIVFLGTSWTQELVYLIQNGADLEDARSRLLIERFTFLEIHQSHQRPEIEKLREMTSPRLIKTHLTYEMMERQVVDDKVKCIVVMRNPKDNYVSFYHFYRINKSLGLFPGTWNQFFDDVIKADDMYYGDPLAYNATWWRNRHRENIMILFYEDMKTNLRGCIEKIAAFLKKSLTKKQVDIIEKAGHFTSMKLNPSTNNVGMKTLDETRGCFMRKGEIGDWKNYFTTEQNEYLDGLIADKYDGINLLFDYNNE